jgi:hypothetical protein
VNRVLADFRAAVFIRERWGSICVRLWVPTASVFCGMTLGRSLPCSISLPSMASSVLRIGPTPDLNSKRDSGFTLSRSPDTNHRAGLDRASQVPTIALHT